MRQGNSVLIVSGGHAQTKIENEGFPSRALRHLSFCAFWGQHLVIQEANRLAGSEADRWVSLEAA